MTLKCNHCTFIGEGSTGCHSSKTVGRITELAWWEWYFIGRRRWCWVTSNLARKGDQGLKGGKIKPSTTVNALSHTWDNACRSWESWVYCRSSASCWYSGRGDWDNSTGPKMSNRWQSYIPWGERLGSRGASFIWHYRWSIWRCTRDHGEREQERATRQTTGRLPTKPVW